MAKWQLDVSLQLAAHRTDGIKSLAFQGVNRMSLGSPLQGLVVTVVAT